jgi:hypothetical protein
VKFNLHLDEAYNYSDDDKYEKGPENLREYWNSFNSFISEFLIGEKKLFK